MKNRPLDILIERGPNRRLMPHCSLSVRATQALSIHFLFFLVDQMLMKQAQPHRKISDSCAYNHVNVATLSVDRRSQEQCNNNKLTLYAL